MIQTEEMFWRTALLWQMVFKVLQGPVLGPLCAISSSLGIGFLGLLSLISPRLNGIIDAKQNVIAEDAED